MLGNTRGEIPFHEWEASVDRHFQDAIMKEILIIIFLTNWYKRIQ